MTRISLTAYERWSSCSWKSLSWKFSEGGILSRKPSLELLWTETSESATDLQKTKLLFSSFMLYGNYTSKSWCEEFFDFHTLDHNHAGWVSQKDFKKLLKYDSISCPISIFGRYNADWLISN